MCVGCDDGDVNGTCVGSDDGDEVGTRVGINVGEEFGNDVGCALGPIVGAAEDAIEGEEGVGAVDGDDVSNSRVAEKAENVVSPMPTCSGFVSLMPSTTLSEICKPYDKCRVKHRSVTTSSMYSRSCS